jgi:ATP-dependent Zn protease
MNFKSKTVAFLVVLVVVASVFGSIVRQQHNRTNPTTYSRFLQQIQSGEVSHATIAASHSGADRVAYRLKNGGHADTIVPSDDRSLLEALRQKTVDVEIRGATMPLSRIIANSAPFLLLMALWFFAWGRLRPKSGAR